MASIKTTVFRKKLAAAVANGTNLPKITKIAFGTGGVDTSGSPRVYGGSETNLFNKVIEKNVTPIFINDTIVGYKTTISTASDPSLNGLNINESALVDEAGDVVAMKTFTNKGMESGVTINFEYEIEF